MGTLTITKELFLFEPDEQSNVTKTKNNPGGGVVAYHMFIPVDTIRDCVVRRCLIVCFDIIRNALGLSLLTYVYIYISIDC